MILRRLPTTRIHSRRLIGRRKCQSQRASSASSTSAPNDEVVVPVVIVGGGPVGLFLSSMLSHYQIPSILLEAQSVEQRFRHPAAHFLNTRTMEIFTSCLPKDVSSQIRNAIPPVHEWQSFIWGRNLCDENPIATVVHPVHRPLQVGADANGVLVPEDYTHQPVDKQDQNSLFPATKPLSPCTVGHLAQHTLGKILYRYATTQASQVPSTRVLYETPVTSVRQLRHHNNSSDDGCPPYRALNNPQPALEIETADGRVFCTNLCLAADGAHSFVRQHLNMGWQPTRQPPVHQELYNIHVKLNKKQVDYLQQYPAAMLYTTLNPTAIAMVVRHSEDEYNIQIPTFPPFQTFGNLPEFLESIFGFPITTTTQVQMCDMWTMTSCVATDYVGSNSAVALVGDAAHVFPPAGGFGLNTGLQDAHNLVWKLAACWHASSNMFQSPYQQQVRSTGWKIDAALTSYQSERRPIALQNAALSIRNYERLLEVTKQFYLNENHPQLLRSILETSSFVPLAARQAMFGTLYQTALAPMAWLSDLQSTYRKHIQSRVRRVLEQGTGLPLLFPRFEILFDYSDPGSGGRGVDGLSQFTEDSKCPVDVGLHVGRRLPYVSGEQWITRKRRKVPTFWLLFREGLIDVNLTTWLSTQLGLPVEAGTSSVVPDADTVVLVRPDDIVAAILSRCSQTPEFEALLVQAAVNSFQPGQ